MKILSHTLSLLWTALAFFPVTIHWYAHWDYFVFTTLLVLSFLSIFISLNSIRLSEKRAFYERLGIRIAGMFVQNGTLIKKLGGRHNLLQPVAGTKQLSALKKASFGYERFHLIGFIFFLLSATRASVCGEYSLAGLIIFSNLIYNVYPVLLQQYYRLRIGKIQQWQSRRG